MFWFQFFINIDKRVPLKRPTFVPLISINDRQQNKRAGGTFLAHLPSLCIFTLYNTLRKRQKA